MKLLESGWVMLKDGIPQGMDQSSGGYPYDATHISSIFIGTEERIKQWAHVMNHHGKKSDYAVAKVSLVLGVDTENNTPYNKCKCGNPGTEDHTCPYAVDIWNDSESLCNCCATCEDNCAADI